MQKTKSDKDEKKKRGKPKHRKAETDEANIDCNQLPLPVSLSHCHFFFCLFSTDSFEGIFALTSNFDLTECTRAGGVISHTTISPGDGVVLLQYVVALVLVGLLVAAAQGLDCFVLGFN